MFSYIELEAAEQPLHGALDRGRRLRVQRQVAEREAARDRLERDVQVRQRAGERRDRAPHEAGEVAGDHQAALAILVHGRELPEPVDEVRAEPEQLHLLGVRVGRDERGQVVHPAADRRRPAGEVVAAPAVAGVGDERRDRGDERDDREQRAEAR